MSRLADLTIVKFVVGASAVAGTYIGLGSLTPSILHFGVQLLIEPLVNIFGSHDEDSIRRTISITLGVIHTLLRLGILVAVVAVYKLYVAVVEKRRLTEFDSRNAFPDIRNGCFLTLLALFAFLTPLFLSGNLVIDGMNAWGYVPQLAVIAATTAVCEEIFFRGLLFRLTENSLGSTIAVLLSSLLLALCISSILTRRLPGQSE